MIRAAKAQSLNRRDGRVVEGARLESVYTVTYRAPLRYCPSDRRGRVKRRIIFFLDCLKEDRLHLDPHQVEANEYPHRHLEFPIP